MISQLWQEFCQRYGVLNGVPKWERLFYKTLFFMGGISLVRKMLERKHITEEIAGEYYPEDDFDYE